jgi:hypothetical protein
MSPTLCSPAFLSAGNFITPRFVDQFETSQTDQSARLIDGSDQVDGLFRGSAFNLVGHRSAASCPALHAARLHTFAAYIMFAPRWVDQLQPFQKMPNPLSIAHLVSRLTQQAANLLVHVRPLYPTTS